MTDGETFGGSPEGAALERAWGWLAGSRVSRAFGLYATVAFAVLQLLDIAAARFDLADRWFLGTAIVLILGLPVVLGIAMIREVAARGSRIEGPKARDPDADRTAVEAVAHLTGEESAGSRRVPWTLLVSTFALILAGGVAAALIGGLSPFGSDPVLGTQDRLVIADFGSQTGDTILAAAVTEALRVDFERSEALSVLQPARVREALDRMLRDPESGLALDLAREVAIREGAEAVLTGEVNSAGGTFIISARVLSAREAEVLAAHRETASDSADVIRAIDAASRELRGRIGESLSSVSTAEGLERVSTPSLPALRYYSQAVRASRDGGDLERRIALLESAVTADPEFAMAHRELGLARHARGDTAGAVDALTRAYDLRERLTDREWYLTLAAYYTVVEREPGKAMTAYRTLLDLHPRDGAALDGLGSLYIEEGRPERAEALYREALARDSLRIEYHRGLIRSLEAQEKRAAAVAARDRLRRLDVTHGDG